MNIFFEIITPLGCNIRTTKSYWQYLIRNKHPFMTGREDIIKSVLKNPDEVRKSTIDPTIYLYYRRIECLYCAVARHHTEKEGFLVTAYPTDKVKERDVIWTR